MSRRLLAAVTTVALSVTLSAGATASAVAAPPDAPDVPSLGDLADVAPPADKVAPALAAADGDVTAFVELDAASGVETAQAGGSPAAVEAAAATVEALADSVVSDAAARSADGAEAIAVTTDLVPGVVVRGDAAALRALATKPGVTSIRLMTPKVPMNKGSDVFTQALAAWQQTGYTGKDVTIGVIDTGLDYTHADFGGPGTVEAYQAAYGADGTQPIPAGLYDSTKFLGGYDFAGYAYDAASDDPAAWVPVPDANPIDAPSGHGTHVAGTAAGFGVQADGTTFRGDYQALKNISDFEVGPGTAPQAGIYALKVFGDVEGSTNLTLSAMEWAADPNDDGDYSDHLDIINMSLGSDYGPADDPENDFIDQLAQIGVLSVVASGNANDIVDVGGSPGNARSALTVANSVGDSFTYDAVDITSATDPSLVGLHAAQNSVSYQGPNVTAPVAFVSDTFTGCTAASFTPEVAAAVAGKIVYLYWDDNDATRPCGSGARFNNAEAAGAAGVLLSSELPVFFAGILGNAGIPGAQLTGAETAALLPEIKAGTLVAEIGPGLAGLGFETSPAAGDTLNPSSSRGVHGSLGIVKPDVAAPGTSISSANAGSGNGNTIKSGTSMATPHVAGIAALVAQAHPDWTALQVKAGVMNTATHDVYTGAGHTGDVYAPERVGSGRVDALAAVDDSVLAFAKDDPSQVSVSFGVVPVGSKTVTLRKKVTVANTGASTRTFSTSFAQATGAGGATVTVSPSSVRVRPGHTATVTVTLTADPATLAKEIDPTSEAEYPFGAREFVTTISGRLVLTDTADASTLRVPVQAAPKLVSAMSGSTVRMNDTTSAPLTLSGRDVFSGGWSSLVAPMVLGTTSPVLGDDAPVGVAPSVVGAADLRQIGYSSTAPQIAAAGGDPANGVLSIGVSTAGEWASLGSTVYVIVDTDVDGDGTPEFESVVWKYSETDYDFTTAETYSLDPATGAFVDLVDIWPVNALPADVETSVFDSNVVVVPMSIAALGLEPGMTPTFQVYTYSPWTEDGVVDVADPFSFDPYAPAYWFDDGTPDSLWYLDTPGTDITVHRDPAAGSGKLLLLHLINDTATRAQVVDVNVRTRAAVQMHVYAPSKVTTRDQVWVGVTLSSTKSPTGTVTVSEGGTVLGTSPVLASRTAGATAVRVGQLSQGTHTLTVTYSGNAQVTTATSTVTITVERARGPWRPS